MDSFRQSLIDYVLSGHAYLHAHTPEKTRFVQDLKEVAAALPPEGRPIFVWSPATGWQDAEGVPAKTETLSTGQTEPIVFPPLSASHSVNSKSAVSFSGSPSSLSCP